MTPEELNAFKLWNTSSGLDRGQVNTLIAALEAAQAQYDEYVKASREVLEENMRLGAKETALRKAVEDRRANNRAVLKTEWNCVSIGAADEYMTWFLSLMEAK